MLMDTHTHTKLTQREVLKCIDIKKKFIFSFMFDILIKCSLFFHILCSGVCVCVKACVRRICLRVQTTYDALI